MRMSGRQPAFPFREEPEGLEEVAPRPAGQDLGRERGGGEPEVFGALAQESQPPARDERPGGLQGKGCLQERRAYRR